MNEDWVCSCSFHALSLTREVATFSFPFDSLESKRIEPSSPSLFASLPQWTAIALHSWRTSLLFDLLVLNSSSIFPLPSDHMLVSETRNSSLFARLLILANSGISSHLIWPYRLRICPKPLVYHEAKDGALCIQRGYAFDSRFCYISLLSFTWIAFHYCQTTDWRHLY